MQNVVHTSDMVEVVRCRDCAGWDRSWRVGDSDINNVHYCPFLDTGRQATGSAQAGNGRMVNRMDDDKPFDCCERCVWWHRNVHDRGDDSYCILHLRECRADWFCEQGQPREETE